MAIATIHRLGVNLLRLLGIPDERVRKAVITLEVNDVVMVDLECYAEEPKDGELEVLAKRYKIKAIDVTTVGYGAAETVSIAVQDD